MANHQRREGRGLRSALVALSLAALACACSREQPAVITTEPNTPPVNYKAEIIAYLRNYLNDPTGVRGAFIAEPELRNIPGTPDPALHGLPALQCEGLRPANTKAAATGWSRFFLVAWIRWFLRARSNVTRRTGSRFPNWKS